MTQNLVSFCRLNADTVPREIIYKVVGEEVKNHIRMEAVEEMKKNSMSTADLVRSYMEFDRLGDEYRKKLRKHMALHRALNPLVMLWAMPYGCALEWGKMIVVGSARRIAAAASEVIKFCLKHNFLKDVDE